MEKHVGLAFPTPVGNFRIPDADPVNAELKRLILEREAADPAAAQKSNAGGWHSRSDLLTWPHPAISTLRDWFLEATRAMIDASMELTRAAGLNRPFKGSLQMAAWANVSRRGNYNRIHNHPGSAWSGVYYVDAGQEVPGQPLSGVLELLDPRPFTEMVPTPGEPFGQKAVVRPRSGAMVIFPGWMYHFVNPYQGEGERISIAFNVRAVESGAPAGQM
jgi:uncharacterized protein (TIGR02466 family)